MPWIMTKGGRMGNDHTMRFLAGSGERVKRQANDRKKAHTMAVSPVLALSMGVSAKQMLHVAELKGVKAFTPVGPVE
jgi:hypothetical protein